MFKVIGFVTLRTPQSIDKTGIVTHCVVPDNIHAHPMEGHWKILRGRGVRTAKICRAKYEALSEIPGGEVGFKLKKPSVEEVWIFSGTTHYKNC